MEKTPYSGQTLIRWRVGGSTFMALPERGARLMNWNIAMGDGSVRDVIHWPEIASLDEFTKARGGNPILFPFCARSFDRGEPGFWRDARGIRRPMPMHGLAREGAARERGAPFLIHAPVERGRGPRRLPDRDPGRGPAAPGQGGPAGRRAEAR